MVYSFCKRLLSQQFVRCAYAEKALVRRVFFCLDVFVRVVLTHELDVGLPDDVLAGFLLQRRTDLCGTDAEHGAGFFGRPGHLSIECRLPSARRRHLRPRLRQAGRLCLRRRRSRCLRRDTGRQEDC